MDECCELGKDFDERMKDGDWGSTTLFGGMVGGLWLLAPALGVVMPEVEDTLTGPGDL